MKAHASTMTTTHARHKVQTRTMDQAIDARIDDLTEWLESHAPEVEDQAHLDEGTRERAYWHHGYLAALRDLRALMRGEKESLN